MGWSRDRWHLTKVFLVLIGLCLTVLTSGHVHPNLSGSRGSCTICVHVDQPTTPSPSGATLLPLPVVTTTQPLLRPAPHNPPTRAASQRGPPLVEFVAAF